MIEIKNLNKKFKRKIVLNNISIEIDKGVYGLLGANGEGKTTLLRCITLLYQEGKKSIFYNGELAYKNKNYFNEIGYLPQNFGLFQELTVFEGMQLLANFKNIEKTDAVRVIEKCLDLVNLKNEMHKRIRDLSGGMIRRLGIAQTLLNNPEIIIFDEPTAGLDPIERLRFKSLIAEIKSNKTLLISTHIIEDIETICDYVIILHEGFLSKAMCFEEVKSIAAGKVYELTEKELYKTNQSIFIVKKYNKNGQLFSRVLSSEKINGLQCEPTIEDGYLCYIKNI